MWPFSMIKKDVQKNYMQFLWVIIAYSVTIHTKYRLQNFTTNCKKLLVNIDKNLNINIFASEKAYLTENTKKSKREITLTNSFENIHCLCFRC